MSFTWNRQTRTHQLDKTVTNNSLETGISTPYFIQSSDYKLYAEESYPMPVPPPLPSPNAGDPRTIIFRIETTAIDGSGEKFGLTGFSETHFTLYMSEENDVVREVRKEREGICEHDPQTGECTEISTDDWDEVHDNEIDDETPRTTGLNVTFTVQNLTPSEQIFASPGSYRTELSYYENGSLLTGFPELVGDYAILDFRCNHLEVECPSDPKEGELLILADMYTSPAPGDSSLFPLGWAPPQIDYKITIKSTTGLINPPVGTIPVNTTLPDGLVGAFNYLWDGKNSQGEFSREAAQVEVVIVVDGPGPGNTSYVTNGTVPCYAGCPKGANLIKIMIPVFSGGAFGCLTCIYRSFDACREPQSMGYGWSSASSARVTEMTGGDLVYRSESGTILRWTLSGSDYVPVHTDNYVEIQKDSGSTTARYVLTSRDHSVMRFDESGKLTETEDVNGNIMSYVYDSNGHLVELSDDRGHTLYYTNRSDGQIQSIRALNPTTGRQMQFQYYDSSDPVAPDRLKQTIDPEGNITQFEYNNRGLLSKRTQIRPSVGNHVTEYEYNSTNRLSAEIVNGELRTQYGYSSTYNENEGTSEHQMIVDVIDPNLPEEQQYPPLRTTKYYNDAEGNLFRIIEGFEDIPVAS
ncbi:MAG: hypothetical protein WC314_27350 [Vulcanimicrobiota bacterium]